MIVFSLRDEAGQVYMQDNAVYQLMTIEQDSWSQFIWMTAFVIYLLFIVLH